MNTIDPFWMPVKPKNLMFLGVLVLLGEDSRLL